MTPVNSLRPLILPIATERLVLREYALGDSPAVFANISDPAYWQHQRGDPPTAVQVDTLLQQVVQEQKLPLRLSYFLAVERQGKPSIIGEAVLKIVNPEHRQGEIGFGVVPRHARQGLATEIGETLLNAAFAHFKLHRVVGRCSTDNVASQRVMQKLGMTQEGLLRDMNFFGDKWWSTIIYGILEDDYATLRSRA